MAFVSLFAFIFIPLILLAEVCMLIEKIVHVLVLHSMIVNIVVGVLLAINAGILAALLVVRAKWKKGGRMERAYLSNYRGWSYLWRFWVKLLLILGPIWQILMVLFCILYLVMQPLQHFAPMS